MYYEGKLESISMFVYICIILHWENKQGTNKMVVWVTNGGSESFLYFFLFSFCVFKYSFELNLLAIFKIMPNETNGFSAFIDIIILVSLLFYGINSF